MEILHTTNEEPFVSGTGHFAGWANRLMKLEDTAILFCREGHAHIMIDLQEYELAPNTQVVLLPDTIVEGGNLAASKIRNLECPSYEICLIDYGCGKFNRKIHIMEQYP